MSTTKVPKDKTMAAKACVVTLERRLVQIWNVCLSREAERVSELEACSSALTQQVTMRKVASKDAKAGGSSLISNNVRVTRSKRLTLQIVLDKETIKAYFVIRDSSPVAVNELWSHMADVFE